MKLCNICKTCEIEKKESYCKSCKSAKWKEYYIKNFDKLAEANKKYKQDNIEKTRETRRKSNKKRWDNLYGKDQEFTQRIKRNVSNSYQKHKEKHLKYNKEYKEKNRDYYRNAESIRRAGVRKSNLCKEQLNNCKEIYKEGLKQDKQVDHIIPLKHKDVCGLHVPWNLQLLTEEENSYKRNKFDGTPENESWRKK